MLLPYPFLLHADKTSVVQIDLNPVFHKRTEAIEYECDFMQEVVEDNFFDFPSHLQLLNLLIKDMTLDRR